MVIAAFFGLSPVMDAYAIALRIPNFFRNLLGEGALSASFVPVFSSFLGSERRDDARRLAQGVLGLLVTLAVVLVVLGLFAAPLLVRVIAPGFEESAATLTVRLVRILFPMSGVMILGGWCLGVLTSHRKFFLPFGAPVLWNLAQIAGLLIGARQGWEPLIVVLAWSTLIGSILQVGVQLPAVRRLVGTIRPRSDAGWEPTRRVVRNTGPVALGQGVFQISSLTDAALASLLVEGAFSGIYFSQRLALLPMALFGVSVAAASLPEMSREAGMGALRPHLAAGVRRVLYFVVPSAVLLGLYGDLVISVIYQRGAFGTDDVRVVQWILAGYATGLIATSLVKLFASGYHAMQDTVTPVKCAAVAVAVGVASGAALMFWLEHLGWGARAAAGLALGGALGAWLNLSLLARGLGRRGAAGWWSPIRGSALRFALGAVGAALVAWPIRSTLVGTLPDHVLGRIATLVAVLVAGGAVYLLVAGIPGGRRARPEKAAP